MPTRKVTEIFDIEAGAMPVDTWPDVNIELIDYRNRDKFTNRWNAVKDYVTDRRSASEIRQKYGIEQSELYRMVRRCYEPHNDGNIFGFRALIPFQRVKPYERKLETSSGYAGKLTQLFNKYPELEEFVVLKYLGKRNKDHVPEPQIQFKNLHKYFLEKCVQLGVGPDEYPFSQFSKGKQALRRYFRKLVDTRFREVVHARYGEQYAKNIDDILVVGSLHPSRPYTCVQLDGHLIDLRMVVWVPTPDGGEAPVLMERIWLLVIMDEASRAILGYHLSFLRNYSNEDVLQCVMNSIVPWEPKELTIPKLEYGEGEGIPSGVIQNCRWRLFDRIRFDNAWSHLSVGVQRRINRTVKCAVNAGEAGKPKRRALVERLFKTLEENGFHRIPSTTGSSVSDTRRRNPDKWAKKYQISLDHLEEVLDVVIAQYNDTPHTALHGRTPLGYLRYDADNPLSLKRFLPEAQRDLAELFSLTVTRRVRGQAEKGRRPYIQFENVPYRNPTISSSPQLVGQKVILKLNILDLRTIKAYLPNGASIGILRAEGSWGIRKHSLKIREVIFKLIREGKMHLSKDPILTYNQLLIKNASKSAKYASQYAAAKSAHADGEHIESGFMAGEAEKPKGKEWRPRKKGWISLTKTSIG